MADSLISSIKDLYSLIKIQRGPEHPIRLKLIAADQ